MLSHCRRVTIRFVDDGDWNLAALTNPFTIDGLTEIVSVVISGDIADNELRSACRHLAIFVPEILLDTCDWSIQSCDVIMLASDWSFQSCDV